MASISGVFIWVAPLGRAATTLGQGLFYFVTCCAAAFSLVAGVLATSRCISDERRHGTLGLLFHSGLSGPDVVLGKFIAASIPVFFGLLGTLPVMGIAVIIGGVSGGEYWRMSLAILNLLFFSLALGMAVSTFSRQPNQASAKTLVLILLFAFAAPVTRMVFQGIAVASFSAALDIVSPGAAFLRGGTVYFFDPGAYWRTLIVTHVMGWTFLLSAAFAVFPKWKRDVSQLSPAASLRTLTNSAATADARRRKRNAQLDRNPVLWLLGNSTSMKWTAWAIVILAIAASIGPVSHAFAQMFKPPLTILTPFRLALKILVAVQATRFLVQARRSHLLEQLVSTSLTPVMILKGQLHALVRTFAWPLTTFIVAHILVISITQNAQLWFDGRLRTAILTDLLAYSLDVVALACLGIWLAVSLKRPQSAAQINVLLLLICALAFPTGTMIIVDLFVIFTASRRICLQLQQYRCEQDAEQTQGDKAGSLATESMRLLALGTANPCEARLNS